MEKILSITETEKDGKEGFLIDTDKQVISLLMDSYQSCCECFGTFISEDDLTEFIGADFLGLSLTDTALNEVKMKEHEVDVDSEYFEGGVMFVDINTSKGTLQFVAYNMHNGYYGHEAYIVSTQLTHSECL